MGDRSGYKVLLVEDEPLILMDLEFAVQDRDCSPLCASGVRRAMEFLKDGESVSVAVLDVSLRNGENCVPIARELERQGIPYVLHSGDLDRRNEVVHDLQAELIPKPAAAGSVVERALSYLPH